MDDTIFPNEIVCIILEYLPRNVALCLNKSYNKLFKNDRYYPLVEPETSYLEYKQHYKNGSVRIWLWKNRGIVDCYGSQQVCPQRHGKSTIKLVNSNGEQLVGNFYRYHDRTKACCYTRVSHLVIKKSEASYNLGAHPKLKVISPYQETRYHLWFKYFAQKKKNCNYKRRNKWESDVETRVAVLHQNGYSPTFSWMTPEVYHQSIFSTQDSTCVVNARVLIELHQTESRKGIYSYLLGKVLEQKHSLSATNAIPHTD